MDNGSTNPNRQGCGSHTQIKVHVSPTTGGDFHLSVDYNCSVDQLKKIVSKRLKVPKDRICLLFREKQLQDGDLLQHGISDGARITLLPNVETGLITQRPEIGIMQALESLNDTQVNEFLCGKAPLNLSMRLGDHMMLIQLQLSTVSGSKPPLVSAGPPPSNNPPSLLQASRNLQHTLRRLSADVFSGRDKGRRESVYSGTFSGALNPALQDPKGRPRRDVATIVHILNDLLCSVPEFRRVTRRNSDESTTAIHEFDSNCADHNLCGNGGFGVNRGSNNIGSSGGVFCNSGNNKNNNNNNNNNSNNSSSSSSNSSNSDGVIDCDGNGGVFDCEPPSSSCIEDQNLRTRGKLEQLRLVMGERRERRRQRKQKPYSLPAPNDTDTVTA